MIEENLNDEHELQSYFIKRIEKYLNSRGKTLIGWDEILEGGLAKNAVVQSWRGMNGGIEAAKHGNKVIMSPTSHAYFDYSIKSTDMKQVYHFDPIPTELDSIQKQLVLGGECNLWSEHIPDEKKLDDKITKEKEKVVYELIFKDGINKAKNISKNHAMKSFFNI